MAEDAYRSPLPLAVDADRDGILDDEELRLAARFAPVVTLHRDDWTRPASVEWLAARLPVDMSHPDDSVVAAALNTMGREVRQGSADPREWVTYVHVYPAKDDGRTLLAYWFFYPYNDGMLFFDHESDWEHVTVGLSSSGEPLGVWAARHGNNAPGEWRAWDRIRKYGDTHPEILSAKGSHASYFDLGDVSWRDVAARCETLDGPCPHVQWRTWEAGGLRQMGERPAPLDPASMAFTGLWGTAGALPGTSAPRGPAFQSGWCAEGGGVCARTVM